jgi:hypothetical protein
MMSPCRRPIPIAAPPAVAAAAVALVSDAVSGNVTDVAGTAVCLLIVPLLTVTLDDLANSYSLQAS